jgi:hypothetical protein
LNLLLFCDALSCCGRFVLRPHFGYNPASRSPELAIQNRINGSMLHLRTWLLVTACLVSVVSATAPAVESIPPPFVPASPADAAIVKRIFANWKARQERTKSFHVEWDTRVVQRSRRTSPAEEFRRALWVDGDDRFRMEFSRVSGGRINWDHMPRGQRTWNGVENRILEWPHSAAAPPQGVMQQGKRRDGPDAEQAALFLAFRPLHRLMGLRIARLRVVTEHAIVDGVHCVKLERSLPELLGKKNVPVVGEHIWVDPARDDVPILFERTLRGSLMWNVAIQYRRSPEAGWVPEHWTCQYPLPTFEAHCTATKLSVNQSLPPKTFQLDFPPGALVFDEPSHTPFLVALDGSRVSPPPFDFIRSTTLRRALDHLANLTIEPEPFGDAIGIASLVFQVPIEIDHAAFQLAGIDPKFEVHCEVQGLSAMELLRWISAQFPKPLALIEQDGKLVFKPLAVAEKQSPANQPSSPLKNVP